jgi:hypothetical protein
MPTRAHVRAEATKTAQNGLFFDISCGKAKDGARVASKGSVMARTQHRPFSSSPQRAPRRSSGVHRKAEIVEIDEFAGLENLDRAELDDDDAPAVGLRETA